MWFPVQERRAGEKPHEAVKKPNQHFRHMITKCGTILLAACTATELLSKRSLSSSRIDSLSHDEKCGFPPNALYYLRQSSCTMEWVLACSLACLLDTYQPVLRHDVAMSSEGFRQTPFLNVTFCNSRLAVPPSMHKEDVRGLRFLLIRRYSR